MEAGCYLVVAAVAVSPVWVVRVPAWQLVVAFAGIIAGWLVVRLPVVVSGLPACPRF